MIVQLLTISGSNEQHSVGNDFHYLGFLHIEFSLRSTTSTTIPFSMPEKRFSIHEACEVQYAKNTRMSYYIRLHLDYSDPRSHNPLHSRRIVGKQTVITVFECWLMCLDVEGSSSIWTNAWLNLDVHWDTREKKTGGGSWLATQIWGKVYTARGKLMRNV